MTRFTIKKIKETLYKPSNFNYAVVKPDGFLFIHCNGDMIPESVYKYKELMLDVSQYILDWLNGEYNKYDTAKMIKESAEIYYCFNRKLLEIY